MMMMMMMMMMIYSSGVHALNLLRRPSHLSECKFWSYVKPTDIGHNEVVYKNGRRLCEEALISGYYTCSGRRHVFDELFDLLCVSSDAIETNDRQTFRLNDRNQLVDEEETIWWIQQTETSTTARQRIDTHSSALQYSQTQVRSECMCVYVCVCLCVCVCMCVFVCSCECAPVRVWSE